VGGLLEKVVWKKSLGISTTWVVGGLLVDF
jgi:hypothetical protein